MAGKGSIGRSIIAAAVVSLLATPALSTLAWAADLTPLQAPEPVTDPFVEELRLGGLAHDASSPEGGSADINIEALFIKPFDTSEWWSVLIPRPHVGATISTGGETSTVYAGVTWRADLFSTPAFFEASFGGSLNNGQTEKYDNDRNPLGCHELFRESAALGYQLTEHWSLMASVEHNSNAGLCSQNRGLTNYGAKIGYRF